MANNFKQKQRLGRLRRRKAQRAQLRKKGKDPDTVFVDGVYVGSKEEN